VRRTAPEADVSEYLASAGAFVYLDRSVMHPDLLNNSLFLRYYKQWQDNPSSVVFAPIAEYLLMYRMVDDAFKVCREGLKHHPSLVSGRLAMSKIHIARGNWEEAEAELAQVLSVVPQNPTAQRLLEEVRAFRREERATEPPQHAAPLGTEHETAEHPVPPSWETVTMAGIFASQGHHDRARAIYRTILERDPENEAARRGMATLPSGEQLSS
jgi:hypothetical protein